MGPVGNCKKMGRESEYSLSKEYVKMQKEAEKLDIEKQKPHPGPTGLQESDKLIHRIDSKLCVTKAT